MKRKMITKLIGVAAAAALVMGTITGCGSASASDSTSSSDSSADATEDTGSETSDTGSGNLSGTVTMAGSTSMEKFANALAEAFMQENPGVQVTAEFTGSSAGLESLASGSVDIGNSSRSLSDDEKGQGLVENIVAIDGIAVVTDPKNSAEGLTKDELTKIYTGEIANWKDVGGDDESIVVIGREAGSGTRGAFEELLEIEDKCKYANELDSTGAVAAKVASTPGAIGYVSLDVVDDTVKPLKIDDVEPSEENIKAGTYLLSRPFVMATKGEISEQSEQVQALFDYLDSDAGQELIKSVGLITVD